MATDYLIKDVSNTQTVTRTYTPAISLPYNFYLDTYANKCRQFIFRCSAYNSQTGDVEKQLSVNGIITDDGCKLLWEHGVTATYYASMGSIRISTIPPYSGSGWQGRLDSYQLAIVTNNSTLEIAVADISKSNYDAIPTTIYQYEMDMPVTSLTNCFARCTSLTQAPLIPSGVTNMQSCFAGCTSLTQAPVIPDSVTSMSYCFKGCTSLIQAPEIPSSVKAYNECFRDCTSLVTAPVIPVESGESNMQPMQGCFRGCTSLTGDIYVYRRTRGAVVIGSCFLDTTQPIILHAMNNNIETCEALAATSQNNNVSINVHPETSISFTDTQMNYMTNEGLKALSLQTNADLVQCEIPDLINGGTITTNVNDALIDLYYRGVIVEYEYLVSGTISSSGITITNNRDGSFTINGTAQNNVSQPLLRVTLRPSAVYMMTGGYVAQNIFTGTYNTGMFSDGTTFGGDGAVCDESMLFPSNMISVTVCFRVVEGNTINNVTIRPRIVKAGDA